MEQNNGDLLPDLDFNAVCGGMVSDVEANVYLGPNGVH